MAWRVARYLVGSLVVLGLAACGHHWLAEREAWRHEAEVACLKSGQVKESASVIRIEPINGPGICGADFPLRVAAIGEGAPIGFDDELRPPAAIPNAPRQPLANPPYAPRVTAPPYQPYPAQGTQYSQATSPYPPQGAYPSQYPQSYPAQGYPQQSYPQSYPPQPSPQQSYPQSYPQSAGAPMRLSPPGVAPAEPEPVEDDAEEIDQPPYPGAPGAPYRPLPRAPNHAQPAPQTAPYPPAQSVPLGRERAPVATGTVTVQPAATLACPIVSSLDNWFASGVQPAAMKWFGVPVAEIKQISAYSCRGMNGQSGAKISEHAFGNALDIAAFTLADGRRITVKDGWRGAPEEQGFLRDIQGSACQLFSTVLAPGSNAFHYDHIHVDLMRRTSGRVICQPQAIPGDVVAARAGHRYARGDTNVTGSIKSQESKQITRKASLFRMRGRDEVYDGLPNAVPGED
jgi:hypothetical protein